MSKLKKCHLSSLEDQNVKILLSHGQEVILGRCPATNIRDKRCSKNQVSLLADYTSETVKVDHLGGNPSSGNGVILRNDSCTLKHNEVLEFLVGKHQFRIKFTSEVDEFQKAEKIPNSNGLNDSEEEACQSEPKRICREQNVPRDLSPEPRSWEKNTWERIDDGKLLIFTSTGVKSREKIAAYDLDGTIIHTKSGRVFPKDNDDWKIANQNVKPKMSKFFKEGYKIVFLTNQAGIGRGKTNVNEFKTKIQNIVQALSIPVQVFISTTNSIYRKPAPGMWTCLQAQKNDGIKIDMSHSFFVGDAAGRIANWAPGRKKDFSSADRLLALNLKLQFYTPEEHFLNEPPGKYSLPSFNPAALEENFPLTDNDITKSNQEVVLMVGAPGSGKSHFVQGHLVPAGYAHVNRDTLGSWQKCVLAMESHLAAGRSVVVDNTNPDRESRKRFLDRKGASVPCRCFLMTTSVDHNRHNNRFRELTDTKHVPVNEMIVNSYRSKFEAPSLEEGFTEVVKVNFVPSFSDPELKKLYQMYLLEK